jgi:hypothetical protein
MSNENNLLLQSAHLRAANTNENSNNNYKHDPEMNQMYKNNIYEQSRQEGFFSKYCTKTTIAFTIASILIILIIFVLIMAYK